MRRDQMSFYGIGEEIYLSRLLREAEDSFFIAKAFIKKNKVRH